MTERVPTDEEAERLRYLMKCDRPAPVVPEPLLSLGWIEVVGYMITPVGIAALARWRQKGQ